MAFWVAAETEVDAYFSTLWFNDVVVVGMESEQVESPFRLSLSLLAVFASSFITSPSGRAIYEDAQLQGGFTRYCLGRVLHGAS